MFYSLPDLQNKLVAAKEGYVPKVRQRSDWVQSVFWRLSVDISTRGPNIYTVLTGTGHAINAINWLAYLCQGNVYLVLYYKLSLYVWFSVIFVILFWSAFLIFLLSKHISYTEIKHKWKRVYAVGVWDRL